MWNDNVSIGGLSPFIGLVYTIVTACPGISAEQIAYELRVGPIAVLATLVKLQNLGLLESELP